MKKEYTIIFCLAVFILLNPTSLSLPLMKKETSPVDHDRIISNAHLESFDNITILYVNGTHYDMGYQHGWFLREEVQQNLRAFSHASELSFEELLEIWYQMEPYVPQAYINEIQGIADGANITFEEVVAGYMNIVWGDRGCFGFAAWGPATRTGDLIHARSFDLPINIWDPVSKKFVHENHVVIVRHPNPGISSIAFSVAGAMHGGGGVNAKGITIGQQVCWSTDQTYQGIPAQIRVQMVLDTATSIEHAISILTTNKTLGWNYILSDSKTPVAYAVENSANMTYVGHYNHSVEDTPPFWHMDHLVRRTNFFIDPDIALNQRHRYDPSGLMGIINYILTGEFFFVVWWNYKTLSLDLEKSMGDLDTNGSLSLLRNSYRGDTSIIYKLLKILSQGTSFTRAWNQWSVCPSSNELAVCFASHDNCAYDNSIHYFNLNALFHPT